MASRNVTIALDEETARWARVEAARRDTSVSRLIAELLHDHLEGARTYERARSEYLARGPVALKSATQRYPTRDEVHDRDDVR